jgi:hypothetical protein
MQVHGIKFSHINRREIHPAYRAVSLQEGQSGFHINRPNSKSNQLRYEDNTVLRHLNASNTSRFKKQVLHIIRLIACIVLIACKYWTTYM